MKLFYEDILVGDVIVDGRSVEIEELLDIVGFDEESFLKEHGWDAIDYSEFKMS